MTIVECPQDECEETVCVDVEPAALRSVSLQSSLGTLDSTDAECEDGHEFYVHH